MSNTPKSAMLGDIAQFIRGINFKPDDVVPLGTEGSVACMRTKNVQSELDLTDVWAVSEVFVRREDQLLQTGDILVSSANSWNLVGKCSWIHELPWRSSFGGFVSVLRGDPTHVDARYLYQWFAWEHTQALLRSFGQKTTNISNLNIDRALALKLPLPPLEEQRRIAAILDQAEALRTQRRTALALLDSLTQSLFLDMFGSPETNKLGYQIASLGNVIKLKSGNFLPSSQMAANGQFPVYGGNGVNGSHDAFMFQESKIVIGRVGAYCGCVHVTAPHSWVTDNALYVETFSAEFQPDYLAFALNKAKLNQYASQSGQPLISGARIASVKLLVPPLPLQQTFATRIQSIEALKATHRRALAALDALFASLQQRAFHGELASTSADKSAVARHSAQNFAGLLQLEASIGQEALIYLANRIPGGDLYKTHKALYFADRHHLEHHGRLIYNETYCALPHGPVPQAAYDATRVLNGERLLSDFDDDALRCALRRQGNTLTALRDADFSKLSPKALESLEWAIRYCRDMTFTQTKTASHDSAYDRTPENEPIPLKYIIETLSPEARQRHWNL